MSECLNFIRKNNQNKYIEFISHYGPALAGIRVWNQNKTLKTVSELLTNSDEAFIHLRIINYGETWKAQEKNKREERTIFVPVRTHNYSFHV